MLLTAPRTQRVVGVVVAVRATSLSNVTGFTLRTGGGELLEFGLASLQNAVEFPPGHLNEHVATGVPVVVEYVSGPDGLEAVRLGDAPATAAPTTGPPATAVSAAT